MIIDCLRKSTNKCTNKCCDCNNKIKGYTGQEYNNTYLKLVQEYQKENIDNLIQQYRTYWHNTCGDMRSLDELNLLALGTILMQKHKFDILYKCHICALVIIQKVNNIEIDKHVEKHIRKNKHITSLCKNYTVETMYNALEMSMEDLEKVLEGAI